MTPLERVTLEKLRAVIIARKAAIESWPPGDPRHKAWAFGASYAFAFVLKYMEDETEALCPVEFEEGEG